MTESARVPNRFPDFLRRLLRRPARPEEARAQAGPAASEQTADSSNVLEAVCRLSGGLAHDLNNILLVVQGYTEMALAEEDAGPSTRALLTELKEATGRATLLVHDLLIVGQRGASAPRRMELNDVVRRLLPDLQAVAGEAVEVRNELIGGPSPIVVDESLIGRLLAVLVARAREAMPDGGVLTISTFFNEAQESVVLRIADTGLPLSSEARGCLFEPYLPGRTGGKGLGLGLSIAWGAARRMGSLIALESSTEAGTVFSVTFPLNRAPAQQAPLPPVEPPVQKPRTTGTETILLAEDDESLLALATKILSREGYTVLAAHDGQEAVEMFERDRERIRLVLVDDVMPRMGGKAALARIRSAAPRIPAILCSGYTWSLDGQTQEAAGIFEILPKPWQPRELLRRVREALERAQ
jgi:two-component system cell cycle sensor histidine kinase/response regulator CckA